MSYNRIQKCRISGSSNLIDILDLGPQPLANSFKKNADDQEEKIPLSISFCPESTLLQVNETVDKECLFNHYVWITGTSMIAKKYAGVFFQRVMNVCGLDQNDFIIEIASNDATFLMPFIKNGYKNVIGIDPAKNIAEIANQNRVKTLNEYWSLDLSKQVVSKYGNAKVVIARNVIPHVSDVLDIIEGVENALEDDGIGIIEFHNLGAILEDLQYDSIYHEHLCYFSINSISLLLNRFNLIPFDIDESPISGGSYVVYFSKKSRKKSDEFVEHTEKEQKQHLNNVESWIRFAERIKEHKNKTLDILSSLKKKIVGFGSSARSQTYLNYCGVGPQYIQAIIDNNPLKQGLYTAESSLPIVSLEKGMEMNPELIFILAWNFRDEIVEECRTKGYRGEFLVPFPNGPYFYRGNP